jgi:hypothetical protein
MHAMRFDETNDNLFCLRVSDPHNEIRIETALSQRTIEGGEVALSRSYPFRRVGFISLLTVFSSLAVVSA